MGSVVSSCVAGLASACACGCCAAVGSVCTSCFGNDKPSTDPPSVASGRKRSVFLLALSVVAMFGFQYGLAPALENTGVPYVGTYLEEAWNRGCDDTTTALRARCRGNQGVFRVGLATVLFYLCAALAAYCKPTSNRESWPAKLFLYVVGVVATVFVPSAPLFTDVFLNIGRVGGALFLVMQQLILLDISYNLNEAWVHKADHAESLETGSGQKFFTAILVTCAVLFVGSVVVIGFLFHFYAGCPVNEAFLIITLVGSVVVTVVQLTGEDASLLTSGFLTAYATYLCLVAVSKNPNENCNPTLKERNTLGIVLGVAFTIIPLIWTGWSNTASKRLLDDDDDEDQKEHATYAPPQETKVQGVVVTDNEEEKEQNIDNNKTTYSSNPSWKINVILLLVTCWISMALTGWGSIVAGGDLANPQAHNISMWMIIVSQWLVLLLYLWTLVAPRLFPDRDFS